MLLYVSSGSRDFGDHPLSPHRRGCWEFYAVLRGRIAPVFGGDVATAFSPLAAESLWVFPPDSIHGWRGEPGRHAHVAVFHFERVPAALVSLAQPGGFLRISLGNAARTLPRLVRELRPLIERKDELSLLKVERALLELAILVLDSSPAGAANSSPSAAQRVAMAEQLFSEKLERRPTLVSIAYRLGISPAHLRRIFVTERGVAPKAALEAIRLARAKELLLASDLKLEAVSVSSGYASASVLVQAFRRAYGVTPDTWRRRRRKG